MAYAARISQYCLAQALARRYALTQALKNLPTPEEQPTLTVDEARPFYGLSRGAMFAAVKRGEIPSIRVGRRILLPTAAVRRQLQVDPVDAA